MMTVLGEKQKDLRSGIMVTTKAMKKGRNCGLFVGAGNAREQSSLFQG